MGESVLIFTDGSCDNSTKRDSARVGGCGYVIIYKGLRMERAIGKFRDATSIRMEMMAVIMALEEIKLPENGKNRFDIVVHSDNQMVTNSVNKGWLNNWVETKTLDSRKNADLWYRFMDIYDKLGGRRKVTIKWIKGHNGHPENELCDKLANEGRKMDKFID